MEQYSGKTTITLHVNGEDRALTARPSDLLLDALRNQLGLTGAKPGCRNGDCGACTVVMDGHPVKSCLKLAIEAQGHNIVTVEGLGGASDAQRAFVEANAFQCGYCTSGFLMVCHALKTRYPVLPDEETIEHYLQANLCRCTSYKEIRRAVHLLYESDPTTLSQPEYK